MASEHTGENSRAGATSSQCVRIDLRKENINKITGPKLPVQWDTFSDWIHCICIVTFDLELGQAIEVIVRNNRAMYHSFVESIILFEPTTLIFSNCTCVSDHTLYRVSFKYATTSTPPPLPIVNFEMLKIEKLLFGNTLCLNELTLSELQHFTHTPPPPPLTHTYT